jgi:hypothetical protein
MDTQRLSFIAGAVSSLIFVGSHVPMLWKAYRTKDLRSYSRLNLMLVNVGNLIYWLYLISLPPARFGCCTHFIQFRAVYC